jgi:hypothetical protein
MITKKSYENCLSVRQMFFKNLFLLFFFFIGAQKLNAQRAMYVKLVDPVLNPMTGTPLLDGNGAATILTLISSDAQSNDLLPEAQNLLEYARDNHIEYLILYNTNNLTDPEFRYNLNVFIDKAKNEFCVSKIGANITYGTQIGYPSGDNLISLFNNEFPNKIDALVCEFEFWTADIRTDCPACDNTVAYPNIFFDYYLPLLDKMKNMKVSATGANAIPVPGITSVDVYLLGRENNPQILDPTQILSTGNPLNSLYSSLNSSSHIANLIDNKVDNVLISAYTSSPNNIDNKVINMYQLFGNTNLTNFMAGSTPIAETQSKENTKVFPIFHGGPGYFFDVLKLDPTVSTNITPIEIEEIYYNEILNSPNVGDNVIVKENIAWFKYQFLPGTNFNNNTNYNANNILFSSNPTQVCNEVTFDYSGPNEDGIEYTWNFGDGSDPITGTTGATDQLASNNAGVHTFPSYDTYTVSLTLQYSPQCGYTYSKQVQISVPLSVNAGNDQTVCGNANVTLAGSIGGTATSATWSSETGGSFSPQATTLNAVYTPSTADLAAGTVTLTLTSNDPSGACEAVSDQVVISFSTPPPATITTNTSTTFCAGGNVILNANTGSGFSYVWKKNGAIIPGQTNSNYTASTAGSYTVVVTIGNGCSTESAVKVVTVNANPAIPTINEDGPLIFCEGASVTLTSSSLSNNLWSTAQTAQSITVTTSGNYFVTVSNANGCSNTSVVKVVTVNPNPTTPSITAYGPLTFCDGSDVLLSSSSTSGNVWSNMQTSQLILATVAGNYSVTVTNASGCSSTSAPIQVTVNPTVPPTFNQIEPICAGETFSLPAISTNNISGTWSPAINYTATTTYTFTPTTGQCVTATPQLLSVNVNPLPVIILNSTAATACSTNTFNDGSASVEVSGTDTYSYLWNDNLNQTTAIATGLVAGDYSVIVTNSSSGCFATGSISVESTDALSYANGHIVAANTSETWESDEPIRLKGIVIVNGTLTIQNSTVMFGYDVIDNNDEEEPLAARFQVNDGGQLNIINSTLTGWCDEFWDGIETRGITNTANVFLNNTTVQNAKIGFTNDRRRNYLKNNVQGGYIVAENSQFLNNRLAVEIKNDASLCRFTKCEFKYNEATLFSYPAPIVCCEWEPTEMTFVHLRKGEGTLFEGNTFSVNTTVYNVLSRGTGIYSEGAKYELRPHSDNTVNLFEGLTSGIKKIDYFDNQGQLISKGTTFDNVQKGIYIQGGNSDIINNVNSFVNIPEAFDVGNLDPYFHTYGIYIVAGGAFDISGNNFSGFDSQDPLAHGSHGIAFSNTGSNVGLCYNNTFSGVDYGVHTQDNNLTLKIRCNVFSADGNDHKVSAFYVANGTLGAQGNANCQTSPAMASEAAGNIWLGPNATLGKSIESFATLPFDYFANPADEFSEPFPFPNNKSGNLLLNPGINGSGVIEENIVTCFNSNSNSCLDPLAGIAPNGQSTWFTSVKIKIQDLKAKLDELKNQFNYLKSLEQGIYEEDLNILSKDIEWLMNEIQLLENQLYKAYQLYELKDQLLDLLINSKSSESTKILTELYLKNQDYTTCRNSIDSIMPITKREIYYINPESAEIRLHENETFVKYMYTNLDMAEAEKTIMTADQKYIDSLQEVVDADMKISVRAGQELSERTHVYYEYPIVKNFGGEKSMKIKNKAQEIEKVQFEVFPIPTNGLLTVNYIIPENALNAKIEIFDLTGKLIEIYSDLIIGANTLQIDLSNFENGLYTCVYKIDGKQISSKKITVIK